MGEEGDELDVEDLIVAAHNDAKSKVKKKTSEELSKITFAGSLFAANPGVKGLPDTRFRG